MMSFNRVDRVSVATRVAFPVRAVVLLDLNEQVRLGYRNTPSPTWSGVQQSFHARRRCCSQLGPSFRLRHGRLAFNRGFDGTR